MGFKWNCTCGEINYYSGKHTTDAITTCPHCGGKTRIWKFKINEPQKPHETTEIPQKTTTSYKTVIKAAKKTEEINLDYWEDMANWAINTIKNKPSVKTGKGQYFRNVGRWSEQLQIIKRLKEGVEK